MACNTLNIIPLNRSVFSFSCSKANYTENKLLSVFVQVHVVGTVITVWSVWLVSCMLTLFIETLSCMFT